MKHITISAIAAMTFLILTLNMISCVKQQDRLSNETIQKCIASDKIWGPVIFFRNGTQFAETICHPKE